MTITDFCKKYKVSKQSVYSAMERHHFDLIGHISENQKGFKIIDEVAEEILKPKNVSAEKYNMVCQENDDLRRENVRLGEKNAALESENSKLSQNLSLAESKSEAHIAEAEKLSLLLNEKDNRISDLEALLSEKDNRIADLKREAEFFREQIVRSNAALDEYKQKCSELEEELSAAKSNKSIFGIGKK